MKLKYLVILLIVFIVVLGFSYYFSLQIEAETTPTTEREEPTKFIIKESNQDVIEEVEKEEVMISDEIPKEEVIYIGFNIFSPKTIEIEKGTKILWINKDIHVHQIKEVSPDNLFRSERLEPGDSYTYTFTQAGEYNYIDSINTYMTGKIIVKSSGLADITGNFLGSPQNQGYTVTLFLFVALGLVLIYSIHKRE